MQATSEVRYSLFPPGLTVTFSAEREISTPEAAEFLDRALRLILPAEIFSGQTIDDLKGCDPAFLTQHFPEASHANHERIVSLSGAIEPLERDEESEIPFLAQVTSEFKEFVGTHHIRHALHRTVSADELAEIPPRELARTVPLRFSEALLSIDLFRTMIFTRMLGFSPAVGESLAFRVTPERLALVIHSDGVKRRGVPPLSRYGLFENTARVMKEVFGVDFTSLYLRTVG